MNGVPQWVTIALPRPTSNDLRPTSGELARQPLHIALLLDLACKVDLD